MPATNARNQPPGGDSQAEAIPFPQPPLSAVREGNAVRAGDAVVITMLDGSKIRGSLLSFDAGQGVAGMKSKDEAEASFISLAKTKLLQLPKVRELVRTTTKDSAAHGIELPDHGQEFEIKFKDGDQLSGQTLSYRDTRLGLYLFPVQQNQRYICAFVSHQAIENWHIGPKIGEMLVAEQLVTETKIDSVLHEQDESRELPLGEYLRTKAVVTNMDLERALERQRTAPSMKLGEILISEELINEEQLNEALGEQTDKRKKPLGEILVENGLVTKSDIQRSLAKKLGIPFVDLQRFVIDPEAIKQIPEKLARQHQVVPLYAYEGKLVVTMENPMDWSALDDLRFHTNLNIEPVMAPLTEIRRALNMAYSAAHADSLTLDDIDQAAGLMVEETTTELDETDIGDNLVVKLVNKIIIDAYHQQASDIHIEPYPGNNKTVVRIRRDGTMFDYYEIPPKLRNAVIARLKIMANLDISERRKPQDGKIDFSRYSHLKLELRIATLPTAGGQEDVVLRILTSGTPLTLDELDLSKGKRRRLQKMIEMPYGLFLVCGPTGSGKTTTLHSILANLNTPDRKIWTAEDPVEIVQKGLRQVQVHPKIGFDFAHAMRAFLRADPDIIMVGEMRDKQTAAIGIEASLTGHLVLSTLHTNSATDSIQRLLNMGMDPYNFSDALLGILGQRLAKRLCNNCCTPYTVSDDEIEELVGEYQFENSWIQLDATERQTERDELIAGWRRNYGNQQGQLTLHKAHGCDECNQTGYRYRIALHELLSASEAIKRLILEGASVNQLLATASKEGMTTLKQDGIHKVLQGLTDIHQVRRVCIK